MAAMSAVPTAATLTPPSSSHGIEHAWNDPYSTRPEGLHQDAKLSRTDDGTDAQDHPSLENNDPPSLGYAHDGESMPRQPRGGNASSEPKSRNVETSYVPPSYSGEVRSRSIKEATTPADNLAELHGGKKNESAGEPHEAAAYAFDFNDENSKWIHRDKLARIESEELQAAGFFLPRAPRPRSKSQSRTRREPSQEKVNGRTKSTTGSIDQTTSRSRKNSEVPADPHTPDTSSVPSWDLRLPEEIAAEADGYWVSGAVKGASKIPVAKLSPFPIPVEHLERGTPIIRKRDVSSGEEDSISYPKTRRRSESPGDAFENSATPPAVQPAKRSATDGSPKKTTPTPAPRKTSGPAKGPANGSAGRPKTRGGPSKDSTSSGAATTRPSTRSGDRDFSSKQPEGDPPWLVSAYRPDPRLPPDQQLLPTVAKRLQQEKWEREGKFGNIYDKEFRPLNEEGFLKPPEPAEEDASHEEADEKKAGEEWPLKPELAPTSPPLGRTGSYTTMPKISEKPTLSPLPSPGNQASQPQSLSVVRASAAQEDTAEKKDGCGCCILM